MSNIDISHSHSFSMKKARAVAEDLAEQLAQQYDLDYEWEDDSDTLHFHRTGVNGNIDVTKDSIDIKAKLGWLLAAMRGMIEAEIHRVLGKHFK